jgi:hypothetical protein
MCTLDCRPVLARFKCEGDTVIMLRMSGSEESPRLSLIIIGDVQACPQLRYS